MNSDGDCLCSILIPSCGCLFSPFRCPEWTILTVGGFFFSLFVGCVCVCVCVCVCMLKSVFHWIHNFVTFTVLIHFQCLTPFNSRESSHKPLCMRWHVAPRVSITSQLQSTQTQRHTHTDTHTDTQTHRHTNAQAHRHTDITDTHTHTHTHTQT